MTNQGLQTTTNAKGQIAPASEPVSVVGTFEATNPVMRAQLSQFGSAEFMMEILHGEDDVNKVKFADFVRARFASDSLNFYDAALEYEKLPTKALRSKGEAIMKRFVIDGAPEAIDLPHKVRAGLIEAYEQHKYTTSTFEEAKRLSFELLKSNFFHKFAESVGQDS